MSDSRNSFVSDLTRTCHSTADRMVVILIFGIFGYCQLFLLSDYVERTGAGEVQATVNSLYGSLGGLLAIYAVLPFFWTGIDHRDKRGGKWLLITSLAGLVFGFGSVFYHAVML